jgi:hypothetical protein
LWCGFFNCWPKVSQATPLPKSAAAGDRFPCAKATHEAEAEIPRCGKSRGRRWPESRPGTRRAASGGAPGRPWWRWDSASSSPSSSPPPASPPPSSPAEVRPPPLFLASFCGLLASYRVEVEQCLSIVFPTSSRHPSFVQVSPVPSPCT